MTLECLPCEHWHWNSQTTPALSVIMLELLSSSWLVPLSWLLLCTHPARLAMVFTSQLVNGLTIGIGILSKLGQPLLMIMTLLWKSCQCLCVRVPSYQCG